jgi:hypothetical protein
LDQRFFHANRRTLGLKGSGEGLQSLGQLGLFVEAQRAP